MSLMRQTAPFPEELAELVTKLAYRPGWTFRLVDMARDRVDPADDASPELAGGLTLDIRTMGYNSYHPEQGPNYGVHHYFIVPAATYNRSSWQRWLLECLFKVEQHEACEFFIIDGEHVYAPNHGPGEDPYIVHDPTTVEARRTSFRGKVS